MKPEYILSNNHLFDGKIKLNHIALILDGNTLRLRTSNYSKGTIFIHSLNSEITPNKTHNVSFAFNEYGTLVFTLNDEKHSFKLDSLLEMNPDKPFSFQIYHTSMSHNTESTSDASQTIEVSDLSILKKDGSIYLHCDPTASHYLKMIMDTIIGNKNFRNECKKYSVDVINFQRNIDKNEKGKYSDGCSTHPHQIYNELLSEHGLIGLIIIFYIFYLLIFRNFSKKKTNLNIVCLIYMIVYFIPILPSGSFFSTFTSTLFWINYSYTSCCFRTREYFKNSSSSNSNY